MSAIDVNLIASAASATATAAETGGLVAKVCQAAKTHPVAAAAAGVVLAGIAAYGGYKLYQHFSSSDEK